jgi:hypothetical protein
VADLIKRIAGIPVICTPDEVGDAALLYGPGGELKSNFAQVFAVGDVFQVFVQLDAHHFAQSRLGVGVQEGVADLGDLFAGELHDQ